MKYSKSILRILIYSSVFLLLLSYMLSCKDKNIEPDKEKNNSEILLSSIIPNPDGFSGAAFMQLIEDLNPKLYDNKNSVEASYAVPPVVIGNKVFLLPGWSATHKNSVEIYNYTGKELKKEGEISLAANSGANAIALKGNTAYISYSMKGMIAIADMAQKKIIKEIDISSFAVGDNNPDPCQMLVRDEILYVALSQIVGGHGTPDPNRAKSDLLLIDTKKNEVIKMITAEGMSMPTKPTADAKSIFIDENDDIYINCLSGFGYVGHDSGFLRIKKGETDFDSSYNFFVSQTAIEGEEHKGSYLVEVCYAGNGVVYALTTIPAYYSTPPNFLTDWTMIPVEVNLKNKTIKRLGTVAGNQFACGVGIYKGKIAFGLTTKDDNGFFIYDPTAQKMSETAIVKTSGNPQALISFMGNF